MKKITFSFSILAAFVLALGLTSCSDEFTEEDALDKIQDINTANAEIPANIVFSVQLVDASDAQLLKSGAAADFSDATLVATQNGVVATGTVDVNGIATFTGMKAGLIALSVEVDGFMPVKAVVDATLDGDSETASNDVAALIPMIPNSSGTSTATISGTVMAQQDYTTEALEAVEGATVLAVVDIAGSNINSGAGIAPGGRGFITSISYDGISSTATTGTDGTYSITVPSISDGLVFDVEVLPFQDDVTFVASKVDGAFVTGEQTATATFGDGFDGAAAFGAIDGYSGMYVSIGAPAGSIPTTAATFTAKINGNQGVEEVNTTNSGDYSNIIDVDETGNNDALYFYVANASNVEMVVVSADINDFGNITDMNPETSGKSFAGTETIDGTKLVIGEVTAVDGDGAITGMNMAWAPAGDFLIDESEDDKADPNGDGGDVIENGDYWHPDSTDYHVPATQGNEVGIVSENGSGAELYVGWDYNGSGAFDLVDLAFQDNTPGNEEGGEGYEVGDLIYITIAPTTAAAAGISVETSSVVAIEIDEKGAGYPAGATFDLTIEGNATATVDVDDEGYVTEVDITDPGTGYTTAPSVALNVFTSTAQAYAFVEVAGNTITVVDENGDALDGVTSPGIGAGYFDVPTVTINSQADGSVVVPANMLKVIVDAGQVTTIESASGSALNIDAEMYGDGNYAAPASVGAASAKEDDVIIKAGTTNYYDFFLGYGVISGSVVE